MRTDYSGTVTVSLDLSIDGDDMETFNIDVDCEGWVESVSGDYDNPPYEEEEFTYNIDEDPKHTFLIDNTFLRDMITAKAEKYFQDHLSKYEI